MRGFPARATGTTPGPCGAGEPARRRGAPHEVLLATAYEKCIPVGASLEITLTCNLRCRHCYNFDRSRPPSPPPQELAASEVSRVIDELADAGCLNLSFTGGEPLMHPDIAAHVRYARTRRFAVKVKTNGTLLAGRGAAKLADAGAFGVDVSLWGAAPGTHDALTNVPGSHAAAVAGIRSARNAGLDVAITFCLVRDNARETGRILSFAEDLGLACRVSPQITARYDGTRTGPEWRLDRETLDALYRGPLRHLVSPATSASGGSVQCACARSTCAVSAGGEVYPCIGAPIPSGNIRDRSFGEIWRGSPQLNRIRALTLDDFKTCKPCPLRPACKRSSGAVFTNTGDYTGAEEWTCMEADVMWRIHLDEAGTHVDSARAKRTGE